MYTLDYFIKKFTAIPEERWIVNRYTDGYGNCCAYGHCGLRYHVGLQNQHELAESNGLTLLMNQYNKTGWDIACVNDGTNEKYPQHSPKQRVLAFLIDLSNIAAGDNAVTTVNQIISQPVIEVLELELV